MITDPFKSEQHVEDANHYFIQHNRCIEFESDTSLLD